MFFAASQNSFGPLELSGIGAREEVKRLQTSLARLANVSGRPAASPGSAVGIVTEKTMISVGGLMDLLQQQLPPWVTQHLQAAMMSGASTLEAKNTVGRYVTELRIAADQASDYFATVPGPSNFPQPPTIRASLNGFFDPGWYTDPARLAIIGGIVLVGVWLYKHKRSSKR